MNLFDLFYQRARRQPDHAAVLEQQTDIARRATVSYRDLAQSMTTLAGRFAEVGVRPGACVGLRCASGLDYIVATYATWRCGGCVVPIPTELTPSEQRDVVQSIALDFVVSEGVHDLADVARAVGNLKRLSARWAVVRVCPERDRPVGLAAVNPAFIRFTSGTTGAAKGVVLSHETIAERIHAANEVLAIDRADRVLWVLPMAYHFAVSIVAYLSFGATIVLPAGGLARPLAQAVERCDATVIYAAPMHYALLTDYDDLACLDSVRLAISTTTALDRRLADRFYHRYDRPLTQALGIIEVGLPCINTHFAADRPEAVGRPLPACELRLADVGLGPQRQEILVRGKGLLDAYYEPWQTRDQIMPTGWFRTGDLGHVDSDGCVFITGRSKEVISVMGMKFFPQEVEAVLTSHPQVAAACVTADEDSRFGHLVVARIVPVRGSSQPLTAARLRAFCRDRLTAAKIPLKFVFVDDVPRTPSGKPRHVGERDYTTIGR